MGLLSWILESNYDFHEETTNHDFLAHDDDEDFGSAFSQFDMASLSLGAVGPCVDPNEKGPGSATMRVAAAVSKSSPKGRFLSLM